MSGDRGGHVAVSACLLPLPKLGLVSLARGGSKCARQAAVADVVRGRQRVATSDVNLATVSGSEVASDVLHNAKRLVETTRLAFRSELYAKCGDGFVLSGREDR